MSKADKSGLVDCCVVVCAVANPPNAVDVDARVMVEPHPEDELLAHDGLFTVGLLLLLLLDIAFMDMDLVIRLSVRLIGLGVGFGVDCCCIICFFSCNVRLEEDLEMLEAVMDEEILGLSWPAITELTRLLLSALTKSPSPIPSNMESMADV